MFKHFNLACGFEALLLLYKHEYFLFSEFSFELYSLTSVKLCF